MRSLFPEILTNANINDRSSNKTVKRLLPFEEYSDKPAKNNYLRSKSCNDEPLRENNFYGHVIPNKNYVQSNLQNGYHHHHSEYHHHMCNSALKENENLSSQSNVVVKPVINVFLNNCISNKKETSLSGVSDETAKVV